MKTCLDCRETKAYDQFRIGRIYELEVDGAPDWTEALAWYRKSAEHGGYLAQKTLGDLYQEGRGVSPDYVQAYRWYVMAIVMTYGKAGILKLHGQAMEARLMIARKMTDTQIGQARELARSSAEELIEALQPRDRELVIEGLARAA